MSNYADTRGKRDKQADNAFAKIATRVAFVVIVIVLIVAYFKYRSNVEGPDELLSLTVENYHDVTSVIMTTDLETVESHLDALSDQLPDYVELVKIVSDRGLTKCVSVKFAVSSENLKRYYFVDKQHFNEAVADLKARGMLTDDGVDQILGS